MNNFIYSTLEKVCLKQKRAIISGPFGSNISSKYFVSTGVPVIRGNNLSLSYDKFYDEGFVFVTQEKADDLNCYAYRGDLIFTAAGTLGQVGIIPQDSKYDEYVISNKQIRVRVDTKKINLLYAYYWFSSPYIQKILVKNNKGSTVPLLTLNEIKNLPIIYPEKIEEQEKIVNCIDAISQKIQCNRKVNATLQQMARTAYMHSFFNKKPNGVLGEIIIENSKSSIPVGDAKKSDGDIPFFTSGDAVLKWPDSLVDGRNCFINDGGNAGIKFYVGKAAYSTHTWSITAKDNLADYMYLFLDSINAEINQKFFQGTGLKNLKKSLLKEREIYIPTQTEIDNFNVKVQSWLTMVSENIQEINTLMNLRDWLLPMLMNGQIKVI